MNNRELEITTIRKLILTALRDILLKVNDPYMISFYIDDIILQIINITFKNFYLLPQNNLIIYDLASKLLSFKIEIKNVKTVERFLESSKHYQVIFNRAKSELNDKVKNFLEVELMFTHLLYFDTHDMRIFVKDYNQLLSTIKNQILLTLLPDEKLISKLKNEEELLITELKKVYSTAEKGFQMTALHLFGIVYSDLLRKISVRKIVIAALGKESFITEINKGMKLANFVNIKIVNE